MKGWFAIMLKMIKCCTVFILLFALSGCLYPQERADHQVPYKTQVQTVQTAVDQYKKETSVLPIKTRDQDTPIYRKYPVAFNNLVPKYMSKPPGNAYQEGGIYQYVLVNAEKKPEVKLVDMRIVDQVQKLQRRLDMYRIENKYPPFDEVITDNRYTIDYSKLGYDSPPYVKSPYSGKNLSFFIDSEAKVHVNYAKDLYEMLQKNDTDYQKGEDIRYLFVEHSFFVPVYSVPYTVENNEPIFLVK
jgi:hypothetical protein